MMLGSSWPPKLSFFSVPTHLLNMAQVRTPGVCLGRSSSVSLTSSGMVSEMNDYQGACGRYSP